MMVDLFWFSSIRSRRPSMYVEEVSLSEGPEFPFLISYKSAPRKKDFNAFSSILIASN